MVGEAVPGRRLFQATRELLEVFLEVPEFDRLTVADPLDAFRNLVFPRHLGSLNENGDEPTVVCPREFDLLAHPVVLLGESLLTVSSHHRRPLPSDHHKHHVTIGHLVTDANGELLARLELRIEEDEVPSEPLTQQVIEELAVAGLCWTCGRR